MPVFFSILKGGKKIPSGKHTKNYGKIHHAINGKIHYKLPSSIANCWFTRGYIDYQRVYITYDFPILIGISMKYTNHLGNSIKPPLNPIESPSYNIIHPIKTPFSSSLFLCLPGRVKTIKIYRSHPPSKTDAGPLAASQLVMGSSLSVCLARAPARISATWIEEEEIG